MHFLNHTNEMEISFHSMQAVISFWYWYGNKQVVACYCWLSMQNMEIFKYINQSKSIQLENVFSFCSETSKVQCLLICRYSVQSSCQRIWLFFCKFISICVRKNFEEISLFFKCCGSNKIVEQMFNDCCWDKKWYLP